MMNAPLPDLRGEHRTEPVPPETHCFVADIDAAFEQQIFDMPQRGIDTLSVWSERLSVATVGI